MVKSKKTSLSIKHRALTGYIKRRCPSVPEISSILRQCKVSGRVGALPPELRGQVDKKDLPRVTSEFADILSVFLKRNMDNFKRPSTILYSHVSLQALFGTPCKLSMRAETPFIDGWVGSFGCVLKMTLPNLQAEYALKVFYNSKAMSAAHGPKAEVVKAFAANKAEPKDNNPVYFACWGDVSFMLSKWAGDDIDDCPKRVNKNKIFITGYTDDAPRNYRGGKRIDFGATTQTRYGLESYNVRKLYRKIIYVCRREDTKEFYNIFRNDLDYQKKKELKRAIELLCALMPDFSSDKNAINFLNINKHCVDFTR